MCTYDIEKEREREREMEMEHCMQHSFNYEYDNIWYNFWIRKFMVAFYLTSFSKGQVFLGLTNIVPLHQTPPELVPTQRIFLGSSPLSETCPASISNVIINHYKKKRGNLGIKRGNGMDSTGQGTRQDFDCFRSSAEFLWAKGPLVVEVSVTVETWEKFGPPF